MESEKKSKNNFLIYLKPNNNLNHIFPIIKTQIYLSLIENFAKVEVNYFIFNDYTNQIDMQMEYKLIKNEKPKCIKIYRLENFDGTKIKEFEEFYFDKNDLEWAMERKINFDFLLKASETVKVTYEYFEEIEVTNNNDGQLCLYRLPHQVFNFNKNLINNIVDNSSEVIIKEIKTNLINEQINITSEYKIIKNKDDFMYTIEYTNDMKEGEDIVIEYRRYFRDPLTQPYISILEKNEKNDFYFYFKAYPYQQIKKTGSKFMDMEKFDHLTYLYTIFIDNFNSEEELNYAKIYSCTIIDRLPKNSSFKIISGLNENYYIKSTDTNRVIYKEFINNIKINDDNSNLLEVLTKVKSEDVYYKTPQRYILLASNKCNLINLDSFDNNVKIQNNNIKRIYFVNIGSTFDDKLNSSFITNYNGFLISTEDNNSVEKNVNKIIKSSYEPYIAYTKFDLPNFPYFNNSKQNYLNHKVLDLNFQNLIRGAKDCIEFFCCINLEKEFNNLPNAFSFSINYLFGEKSYKIQSSINFKIADPCNKFHLMEIFSNYENNLDVLSRCNEKRFSKSLRTDVFSEGDSMANDSWIANKTMTDLRIDDEKSNTSIGNLSSFNFLGVDSTNNNGIFNSIKDRDIINDSLTSNIRRSNIHKAIMNKLNKQNLLNYDENFIFEKLKVDKAAYSTYIEALKKNSKKLFNGVFNKIENSKIKNLAFTIFAVAYLDKHCKSNKQFYEKSLNKILTSMKDEYDYSSKFQKEADFFMGNILEKNI